MVRCQFSLKLSAATAVSCKTLSPSDRQRFPLTESNCLMMGYKLFDKRGRLWKGVTTLSPVPVMCIPCVHRTFCLVWKVWRNYFIRIFCIFIAIIILNEVHVSILLKENKNKQTLAQRRSLTCVYSTYNLDTPLHIMLECWRMSSFVYNLQMCQWERVSRWESMHWGVCDILTIKLYAYCNCIAILYITTCVKVWHHDLCPYWLGFLSGCSSGERL